MNYSYIDNPFHVDEKGLTAATNEDDHLRDLIYQVLFTSPGERVNRPDFGCGLKQLVFMPNSDALATATQFLVQGSLQRWLDSVIQVEMLDIQNQEEILNVNVVYIKRSTGERRQESYNYRMH